MTISLDIGWAWCAGRGECDIVTLCPAPAPPAPVSLFWLFHGAARRSLTSHILVSIQKSNRKQLQRASSLVTSPNRQCQIVGIHDSTASPWNSWVVKIWMYCREHDRGHSLEWFCTRYYCASLWTFSGIRGIVTLLTKYFGASRGIVS